MDFILVFVFTLKANQNKFVPRAVIAHSLPIFFNCIFICLAELMMKIFPAVTLPESLSEAPTNLD